jgi:K+-transporting ATPase KdpF subunit
MSRPLLAMGVLAMLIWLTIAATVFLFIYLGAALMRPEWF